MNPDASSLWRAPRWQLALRLACLGMFGPSSIDTYLPVLRRRPPDAGRIPLSHPIRHGFLIMLTTSVVNVMLNLLFEPHAWWAAWPTQQWPACWRRW